MAAAIRIAIDAMGGDAGLRVCCPAALIALGDNPALELTLVGDRAAIESCLAGSDYDRNRLRIVHAGQVVDADDKPSQALRHKPDSSMRRAVDLLQQGEVDAVVSAGNTGALMAISYYVLKTFPGIDRPAICSPMPTASGHSYLLDLGANVDCDAAHLHQFALMGSAMAAALDGLERPRVALLNIGEEAIKGNEQVKMAAALLEADEHLNYRGFIEGDSLYRGAADVVVCDGFVGNVALKVCEGTAELIREKIHGSFTASWWRRLMGTAVAPALGSLLQELDPKQYNGACLLGLQGVVVKSHGKSDAASFAMAIRRACSAVENRLLQLLDQRIAAMQ